MKRIGALLLLLLAACGNTPKPEAPKLVAAYPGPDQRGVARGEAIVLTFDRPMDRAATEAAFSLWDPDGRPLSVTFAWEDGDRRLRVTPSVPWRYSPDDRPIYYRYRLSTGARSKEGAPLAEAYEVQFATLRTLEWEGSSSGPLDGAVSDLGMIYNDPGDPSAYRIAYLGDLASNHTVRAFFVFELAGFPEDAVELADASLRLWLAGRSGNPFLDLGILQIARVDLGPSLNGDDYAASALGDPLEQSPGWVVQAWRAFDVTPLLAAALGEGAARLDLRLAFSEATDNDGATDRLEIATGEYETRSPKLVVRYYAP